MFRECTIFIEAAIQMHHTGLLYTWNYILTLQCIAWDYLLLFTVNTVVYKQF